MFGIYSYRFEFLVWGGSDLKSFILVDFTKSISSPAKLFKLPQLAEKNGSVHTNNPKTI